MKITVVPSDPKWPEAFARERSAIVQALGEIVEAAHHVGSTAVPGLAAKPILDILLEVGSLAALDDATPRLEALGYEAMGEFGIAGRRYFRKGGDRRTHQIHAFVSGDPHGRRHLAFRDYLRVHPAIAEAYGRLKADLAARHPDDLDAYCDGKDAFVKEHEAKALAWSQKGENHRWTLMFTHGRAHPPLSPRGSFFAARKGRPLDPRSSHQCP